MTRTQEHCAVIEAHQVPEHQRAACAADAFGAFAFPFKMEPAIFQFAGRLSDDYQGGRWEFYELNTGGFFMAPDDDKQFQAAWPDNYSRETLSAEAFGLVCCLFACSHLSFAGGDLSELAARAAANYHLLLPFVYEHPEAQAILSLID